MLNTFNDSMHQSILSVVSANTTVFIDRYDATIEELEKELAIVGDDIIELQNNQADTEYDINVIKAEQENTGRMLSSIADKQLITDNNVAGLTERVNTEFAGLTARVNTEFAVGLSFEVDPDTYVLAVKLHNSNGVVIAEKSVDLPLESVVVAGGFDETASEIVLTLQNGNEIRFPVSNIVGGFISDKEFEDFLATKGQANGFAGLDASGKVPKEQLPDDIGSGGTGGTGNADTSELVKYTDFKIPNGLYSDGKNVYLASATKAEITAKSTSYKPISPYLLDYAFKVAATDNKEEWTPEDKAKACETIGAVKTIEYFNAAGASGTDGDYHGRVYAVKYDGTEETVPMANQASNYSICWRDAAANIYVGDPTQQLHCVNKRYAEANFVAKDTTETEHDQLYLKKKDGTFSMINVQPVGGQFVGGGIPRFSGGGCIAVSDPTEDAHATNKKYVDDNFVKVPAYGDGTGVILRYSDGSTTAIDVASMGEVGKGGTIPRYSSTGTLAANDPVNAADVVNKQYADTNFIAKPTDTSGYNRVICVTSGNALLTQNLMYPNYTYDESGAPSRTGIPVIDKGNIGCALPTADYHTANKKYVDDNVYKPYTIQFSISNDTYAGGNGSISIMLTPAQAASLENAMNPFNGLLLRLYNNNYRTTFKSVPLIADLVSMSGSEDKFIIGRLYADLNHSEIMLVPQDKSIPEISLVEGNIGPLQVTPNFSA